MEWFYSNNGKQEGPISESELKAKIGSGLVKTSELAWHEGMNDWQPISSISALAPLESVATAPIEATATETPASAPAPAPASAQPAAPSPYQSPGSSVNTTADPTPGKALPSYMWQSIVTTLLCCLPFGIVAIVYAAKVDGLKQSGDLAAARAASNSAKLWVNISAGIGLLIIIISMLLNVMAVPVESTVP